MERMKKERPLIRYEKLSKEDLVDYCRVYWRRIHNDEMLFNEIYEDIESLKSDASVYKSQMNAYKKKYLALLKANTELDAENQKLREELGEYKKMFEDHLKECYIKNTAEFLDKKFPAINGFMEEDTLQELRDLGKI